MCSPVCAVLWTSSETKQRKKLDDVRWRIISELRLVKYQARTVITMIQNSGLGNG